MIQKIKLALATMALSIGVLAPLAAAPAYAAITDDLCTGSNAAAGSGRTADASCGTTGSGADAGVGGLKELARKVVRLFSLVVGAISILMIIYGGFRYITSGGDSGKVGNAKNTLIYAIVGLIIVALAQIIVRFVVNVSSQTGKEF